MQIFFDKKTKIEKTFLRGGFFILKKIDSKY